MEYKLYLTGGFVRDRLLGLKSKDIDYSVVIKNTQDYSSIEEAFNAFVVEIKKEGYQIFLETPSCLTVRAKFPKDSVHKNLTADFVLARKELAYIKGTRTPEVVLGSLYDDLCRRDFSINALAEDEDGNLIDFFNGQGDLHQKILRTPLDTSISFNEDSLRLLRAMRFSITKGLSFSDEIINTIKLFNSDKMNVVSDDRIREELLKMFKHSTTETLKMLRWLSDVNNKLHDRLFEGDIWLKPTNEK